MRESIYTVLLGGGSMFPGKWRFLLSLLPIIMIGLGARHFHECPKEPMLTVYLVVGGAASLMLQLLPFLYCHTGSGKPNIVCRICNFVLYLFCFVWLIVGSVFVYRAYLPDFESSQSPEYCERTLYIVTFLFTTGIYIFIMFGIIFLVYCLLCGSEI